MSRSRPSLPLLARVVIALTDTVPSGHDVTWNREDSPGITDREVLELANLDQRLLLTFDKTSGSWLSAPGARSVLG